MASPQFDTVAVASSFPNDTNTDDIPVRKELWYACAGSVSGVPKRGQRVYYFPQGHIEQLQGTTKPQHNEQLPFFKVPSKILCSVTSVSRKVQWDGPSGRIQRPDRVSPWEVEPYVALPFQSVPPTINKRLKSTDVPPASDARTDLASTSGTAQLQHKDKQKMNENPTNFRLFGIDLANASVVLPRKQPLECPTIAVGRVVDQRAKKGYEDRKAKLEKMFELEGGGKRTFLFSDNEGDTMLLGDDRWPEFCKMVRRIFICSSEEVKMMKPG
ncbi:Auxin response factor 18 [Linum grandiflorum]